MIIGETVVCIANNTNFVLDENSNTYKLFKSKDEILPIIIGNKYLIEDTTTGREAFFYRVRNSLGELAYYNSDFFVTIKEYREKQLNDLGI
jgi:hypothetical protein